MRVQTIRISLAALAAVLVPLSIQAAEVRVDTADPLTAHVTIADLDLRSAAGQAVLHQRVGDAAKLVCAGPQEKNLVDEARRSRHCTAHVVAESAPMVEAAITAADQNKMAANELTVVRMVAAAN